MVADTISAQLYFWIPDKLKPPTSNSNLNLAKENFGGPLYQIIFLNNLSIQRRLYSILTGISLRTQIKWEKILILITLILLQGLKGILSHCSILSKSFIYFSDI